MIHANEKTNIPYRTSNRFPRVRNGGPIRLTMFSWGLQQLLSSYSKGINKQFGRTGSLFQQNTKIKQTSHPDIVFDYSLWCFIYIHNNASDAGLVEAAEDYEFSSLHDYIHDNENSLCNIELAKKLLCLDMNDAIHKTEFKFPDEVIKEIH